MYVFLNKFLRSKYFDSLPKFFARKIFKIFKIFFVETELESLPQNNHPTTVNENQLKIMKNVEDNFYKPFSTCAYLLELLSLYGSLKNQIKFLDFGANNLDNYAYLNKYIKNIDYLYHDLPSYNKFIYNFIIKNQLKNIKVINDLSTINNDLDFVFFGSSIHYVNDYKEILKKIIKFNPRYLLFSHTPFYMSGKSDKDIVMKQVNIHPTINYAYFLEYKGFLKFMKENNYTLLSENKNNFIKFLNFKNFKGYTFISFLDLLFKKID